MSVYTVLLFDQEDYLAGKREVQAESAEAALDAVGRQLDKDWLKRGMYKCACGRDRHTYECRTVWSLRVMSN